SARGGARTALVDPAALPVADRSVDAARADGILDSTLHADAVLAELHRVTRTGGGVDIDVGNAAAARGALRRGDLVGLVMRARAARGRAQLSGRQLLEGDGHGSMSLAVPVTHAELLDLARAAGIEPAPEDVRPPLHVVLANRIRLRGRAAPRPGRRAQPWWPPLL